MTIEKRTESFGVDVHFDSFECELFMKLALDLEKLQARSDEPAVRAESAPSYFSLSVELGKKIRALSQRQ